MDTYLDTLAPWEKKKAYYSNIKPGNKIIEVKEALKKQAQKMLMQVVRWIMHWYILQNWNRILWRISLFVCERYNASVKMERD